MKKDIAGKMAEIKEMFVNNKIVDSAGLVEAIASGVIDQNKLTELGEQIATLMEGPDETELGNIARNEDDKNLRKIAIKKLTDQDELGDVARNEDDRKLRKIAIKKLTDQDELGNVARNEDDRKLRKIAIMKLTDQDELGNVARNEQDKKLRKIAIKKLAN
ncbi:MAG: hypothetical protein ABIP35_12675 [Ginsengibacter sp.]